SFGGDDGDSCAGVELGDVDRPAVRESSGQVYDCGRGTSTRPLIEPVEIQGIYVDHGRAATVGRPVKDGVNYSARKRRADRGLFPASPPLSPPSRSEKFAHPTHFNAVDSPRSAGSR